MLVRYGLAGCILACLVTCLLALDTSGSSEAYGLRAITPYALLCFSMLTFLAGEAMLMVRGFRHNAARRRQIRTADAGAAEAPITDLDDLVGMLDDAVTLGRPMPTIERLEPIDVASMLESLTQRQDVTRLRLDARPRLSPHTLASRPAIKRAFEILVENALANGSRAAVSYDSGTSALVVHVDDDGPGVPRSERAHVFEWRYYMSTPPSRQTGCRAELVIAQQIVRAHGGDIVVGSSPQGGARFTTRLPLLGEHEIELAAAS